MNNLKNFSTINLGEQIKTFRLLNNYTVKDIQTYLYKYGVYVHTRTIYRWENNNITPNLSCILVLCEIFNITTTTLLTNNAHNKPNLAKAEMNFLQMFRNNRRYKRLILSLYNKEASKNDKNRTKTKNVKKNK